MIYKYSVLLSFFFMPYSFAYDGEKDWLSGEYTVFLSDFWKEKYAAEKVDISTLPTFKVKKRDKGWVVEQNGDEVKLSHSSTEPNDFYSDAFPENLDDEEMQCGISGSIILCHVTPLSNIEDNIVSTGYFLIKREYGYAELTKLK